MAQHGVEKSHWRKHWQWFELRRNLATVVTEDDVVRRVAESASQHPQYLNSQAGCLPWQAVSSMQTAAAVLPASRPAQAELSC